MDSGAKDNAHGDNATRNLAVVQDVVVQSEIVGLFVHPVKCDEDGNVYMRRELDATSGIIKVDPKEKRRVAMFAASSATDWHVSDTGYFALILMVTCCKWHIYSIHRQVSNQVQQRRQPQVQR